MDWLKSFHIQIVALESTGVYWRPIFNLLEAHFQPMLVNTFEDLWFVNLI
jgi:transposase